MHVSHFRLAPNSWLSWPRRSARLRLTALCGGLFLLFSATLLGATYIAFERATQYKTPRLPKVPGTPAIRHLQPPLAQAQERLALAQHELAQALPSQVAALSFTASASRRSFTASDQRMLLFRGAFGRACRQRHSRRCILGDLRQNAPCGSA
jgi:hypothetical protein